MKLNEVLLYALQSLGHRKIRSWLTILGIIVGITAVIVLVGLAQGLKEQVDSQLQSFGPRTILVAPYSVEGSSAAFYGGSSSAQLMPSSGKLYETDVERIKRIGALESVAKVIFGRANVGFKGEEITANVYAVEANAFKQTLTIEVERGRFMEESDRGVAVIGNDIAENTFKNKKVDVGSILIVGGKAYPVIGVLKKTGNSFSQLDNVIFIQFEEGKDLFAERLAHKEISAMRIVVKEGYSVSEIGAQIEDTLLAAHKVTADKKDFTLVTPEFINNQVGSITGMLTAFLGGIAAISLLIGGIGISNTMFMSVLERRKEIGVLKSIGATGSDIMDLFIFEAAIIGFFGGIAGIGLGWAILKLIAVVGGFPASFTPLIALGALTFSSVIGIIAGALPAKQAAALDPIEALRYE